MRALYSGVTGIRAHQTRMDVIGNNIANVNTIGFKSSRVSFTDVFTQTLSSGSQRTNPMQIGLGVGVGSTDLITDDGSFQSTGRALDLAIQGAGLFVLRDPSGQTLYTRAGNLDWNKEGYLFNPANGMRVQGWMADATGKIDRTDWGTMTDIRMIKGDVALGQASTSASFKGNLDAAAKKDDTYETPITVMDSLGRPHKLIIKFTKQDTVAPDGGTWKWEFSTGELLDDKDPSKGLKYEGGGDLTFLTNGKLKFDPNSPDTYSGKIPIDPTAVDALAGADPLNITVDFRNLTQAFANTSGDADAKKSSVVIDNVNGMSMGTLDNVFVDDAGVITGRYTNGTNRVLGQIALAGFNNMAGLMKVGASTFAESPASGQPQVGKPGEGGRGSFVPGNLEGSNVDLAGEFTNMIMTQRGYQANTRVVSTADDMLQELINMRR